MRKMCQAQITGWLPIQVSMQQFLQGEIAGDILIKLINFYYIH